MSNYFSKSCNKTAKAFFEDYDKLPAEIKRMLYSQNRIPTFEDLKAAWEIVADLDKIEPGKTDLNVFEAERKEYKKKEADRLREAKRRAKQAERMQKYTRRPIYEMRRVEPDPKNARLIARVSEQEAVRLMASRAENKDVKIVSPVEYKKVFIGYRDEIEKANPEKEIKYLPDGISNSLSKQMHNA